MSLELLSFRDWGARVTSCGAPVLVCFMAKWCRGSRVVIPRLEAVKRTVKDRAYVYLVDVDEEPSIIAMTSMFHVQALPTCILFSNGEEASRLIGARNEAEYLEAIRGCYELSWKDVSWIDTSPSEGQQEAQQPAPDDDEEEKQAQQGRFEFLSAQILSGLCVNYFKDDQASPEKYSREAIRIAREYRRLLSDKEVKQESTPPPAEEVSAR